MASSCRAAKLISTLERGDKSQQQGGNRTLGAVTRDTFTVIDDPFSTARNWRGAYDRTFPR